MAYIVLALGVLMALVGLGAMATGYPIIEVERGWATLIAGSVLLSGGVVTAALGLVVRVLLGLEGVGVRRGLAQAPAAASQSAVQATPSPAISYSAAPAPPAIAEAAAAPELPAFAAVTPVAATAAFGAWEMHEQTAAPDLVAEPPFAGAKPENEPSYAPHAQEPDYLAEDVHAPLDEAEHADAPSEPHEAHQAASEPLSPRREGHARQNEAWLDQAFQAFDYEMGGHPPANGSPAASHQGPEAEPPTQAPHDTGIAEPRPPAPAEEAADEDEAHDVVHHDVAHHDVAHHDIADHDMAADAAPAHAPIHEPAPPATSHHTEADAPATAPEEPSNLAVIGRYDSEGTSYVMYADGSIEAQSEAGVYRFGSMAELKAFIEG